ncbi:MAG: NAD(P)H-hydrate dehydratase [Actinomycetes bacterium]
MTVQWLDRLVDAERSREADQRAIQQHGISGEQLMEAAATGLADLVEREVPDGRIVVVSGKGNNGGDGIALARILRERGREVDLARVFAESDWKGDSQTMLSKLVGEPPVAFAPALLEGASGIVDCLLGTGAVGAPKSPIAEVIEMINRSRLAGAKIVACDLPSGVESSTGVAAGEAVNADATATFDAEKIGLWIRPGKALAGRVELIDIGIPKVADGFDCGLISDRVCQDLPRRSTDSDKFAAGEVVVAGGSPGLTGAPMLAALGAARGGAGYVAVALPEELLAVSDTVLELMGIALASDGGNMSPLGVSQLIDRSRRAGAVVLGPGLGKTPSAAAFALSVAITIERPLVIDADAIGALAGSAAMLCERNAPTVITPHAGEMAQLIGWTRAEVESRRMEAVRLSAAQSEAVVVLKGDDSLIADPAGAVAVSRGGAPALATAGSGDILSGLIAALLAQGVEPFRAACAAVRIHLEAGRLAAANGVDGVIAGDIVGSLRQARSALSSSRSARYGS